jgi:hypothetical protein
MRSITRPKDAHRRRLAALRGAALVAVLAATGACAGSPATTPAPVPKASAVTGTVISAAVFKVGQRMPAPTGKPVLSMTGKISARNQADAFVFDQPMLEQLGVRQVPLYEPWTKQNLDFRGVWLADLLAIAGVQADASTLRIVALDDYVVNLSLADIRAGGIMLATRAGDGSLIPVDDGGPTRIVFTGGVKAGANPDQWIWSIKTIDVH